MPHSPIVHRWAEGAIVYQIYPRSFKDSNGDGVGDIPGITSKLGYLKELGVNAIWLSPFYPSPQADFGYDVADYCAIDPQYGTMQDFTQLIHEATKRDIRVIVDIVPNHSSSEHPWFLESRKSRHNSKSDWYIWRDPIIGANDVAQPPNNWIGVFNGETAWEWCDERGQYYLHSFDVGQPDLNWANPEVRAAFKDILRFWLDLGVSGFRVDAVYFMAKDPLFGDDLINSSYDISLHDPYERLQHTNSRGWPMVYAYLSEMAAVLQEPQYAKNSPFMVTEAYPDHTKNALAFYLSFYVGVNPEVSAPFIFEGFKLPWEAQPWRSFIKGFHAATTEYNVHCIGSYAFGNHDRSRLRSRLGDKAARACAVLALTLPGMVFIYNGEELGMHDVTIPPERVMDPAAVGGLGRDPVRTPMQWDQSPQAGFTTSDTPWLPVSNDYAQINVEAESGDGFSFLALYRSLCALRSQKTSIRHGSIRVYEDGSDSVLCYLRYDTVTKEAYFIAVNFKEAEIELSLPNGVSLSEQIVTSNNSSSYDQKNQALRLPPQTAAVWLASSF